MKKSIVGTNITFTFAGLAPIAFDATKVSAANRAYAEMHGWQARIGDSAALSRAQKDGTVITITEAMRREAIAELVTHYESGSANWSPAGGPRAVSLNPTWLAIATKRNVAYDVIAAEMAARDLALLAE